jgi:hypothetical protein
MDFNQHEVSARSRNQYSVVGDSGKVVRTLEVPVGTSGRRRRAALV